MMGETSSTDGREIHTQYVGKSEAMTPLGKLQVYMKSQSQNVT